MIPQQVQYARLDSIVAVLLTASDSVALMNDEDYELFRQAYSCIALEEIVTLSPGVWICTSGSTALKKAVLISYQSLFQTADVVNKHFQLNSSHDSILCLSPYHIAGFMVVVRAFRRGAEVYDLTDKWSADTFIALASSSCAHNTSLVSTQLYDLRDRLEKLPQSLKVIFQGAMGISESILHAFRDTHVRVIPTYGMTETSAMFSWSNSNSSPLVFQCFEGYSVSSDNGNLTIQKCNSLCSAKLLLREKKFEHCQLPFLTGDLAQVINENTFIVQGRKDYSLKIMGSLYSLEEIENSFRSDSDIRDVAIVATLDERLGYKLHVFLESKHDTISEQRLMSAITRIGLPSKVLTHHLVHSLPRLESGKVDRVSLQRMVNGY